MKKFAGSKRRGGKRAFNPRQKQISNPVNPMYNLDLTKLNASDLKVPGSTKSGRDWFVIAVDPNHDWQTEAAKFPGLGGAASYVVKLKYSQTVETAGNDLHIFTPNELTSHTKVATMARYDINLNASAVNDTYTTIENIASINSVCEQIGPVIYHREAADSATFEPTIGSPYHIQAVPDVDNGNFTTNDVLMQGPCRLVAQALETRDITAPMYQQGKVCVYRMANEIHQHHSDIINKSTSQETSTTVCGSKITAVDDEKFAFLKKAKNKNAVKDEKANGGEVTAWTSSTSDIYRSAGPPHTYNQAVKIPGSRVWNAKEGSYQVNTLMTEENPYSLPRPGARYLTSGTHVFRDGNPADTGLITIGDDESTPDFGETWWLPTNFDSVGAYYTGGHSTQKIEITLTQYVEICPAYDSTNITMATPPPDYDPTILEYYQRVIKRLPPGVTADENAAGDFFRSIVKIVNQVAPWVSRIAPALRDVPFVGPIARVAPAVVRGIGNASGVAAKVADRVEAFIEKNYKKKK